MFQDFDEDLSIRQTLDMQCLYLNVHDHVRRFG